MKLIIAGSRDLWVRHDELFEIIDKFGILYRIKEIVSGCASGIDSGAIEFASRYRIPLKRFPADWEKYGGLAGPRRNREMARYADALLVIHSGSTGSLHMKKCMLTLNKPIYEVVKEK